MRIVESSTPALSGKDHLRLNAKQKGHTLAGTPFIDFDPLWLMSHKQIHCIAKCIA